MAKNLALAAGEGNAIRVADLESRAVMKGFTRSQVLGRREEEGGGGRRREEEGGRGRRRIDWLVSCWSASRATRSSTCGSQRPTAVSSGSSTWRTPE
eukprot:752220-Hanusia_phi.AAC.2